ncbi:Transcriptional regulator, HxlR family [uncultured Synechococcales cyanobacterium]|uniref:Transcriptional regulator, HxlR family n=1 Tax=uncultured Synechococcales cyanobacterium TaxID=1936017 RepID=A0A6J4VX13_9CYAN|nr:Transcriptional regulator, HxlR family [uncultured Synechococcales cyanobacterium]
MSRLAEQYGCPVEVTTEVIGGKWKSTILWWLRQSAKRPNELMQLIPGISQKVLTRQLRELEADGLIDRQVYQETPPRVEYSLTSQGETLRTITELMCDWGKTRRPGYRFGLLNLEGLHILVVADAPDACEQIRVELGVIRGAQVTTATVTMMSEQLRQVQVDVVIVDFEMTAEDLSVLSQQIQLLEAGQEKQLFVVALSDQLNRSRAFAQGFRIVLTKPVEPAELAAAIASFTGRLG